MTPKDKAFELAHKFRLLEIRTSENSHMMISMADAKQCALIAVDEILTWFKVHSYSNKNYDAFVFYNEVKQEIEAL